MVQRAKTEIATNIEAPIHLTSLFLKLDSLHTIMNVTSGLSFVPYTKVTDLFISAHFWDPRSPKLFTKDDMKANDFHVSVIADITCDIDGSVPTTIRSSTITQPFYGYNILKDTEDLAFSKDTICIMAVDNLPCELSRDASDDFGKDLTERVLPHLIGADEFDIIGRASICIDGKLTKGFDYLSDYAF